MFGHLKPRKPCNTIYELFVIMYVPLVTDHLETQIHLIEKKNIYLKKYNTILRSIRHGTYDVTKTTCFLQKLTGVDHQNDINLYTFRFL